jgi:hypothetical protein
MDALTQKMNRLDKLVLEAGWVVRRLVEYADESRYRTARGLNFWVRDHLEDSGHVDGGYRITGSTQTITVVETGLNVFEDGWKVAGPWQEVAEPALDELIATLEAMIAADDAAKASEKAEKDRLASEAYEDLLRRSREAFGGN